MTGLDQSIIEHRLPIKPGYRPFKQAPRRFNPNVLDDIKKVFTPKFGRRIARTRKLPRSCHQGIDCTKVDVN